LENENAKKSLCEQQLTFDEVKSGGPEIQQDLVSSGGANVPVVPNSQGSPALPLRVDFIVDFNDVVVSRTLYKIIQRIQKESPAFTFQVNKLKISQTNQLID
jgi:hypothetical protein